MKTIIRLMSLALLMPVFVASCSTTTRIQSSWVDAENSHGQFGKILVLGAGRNLERRRLFENNFTEQLDAIGVEAVSSLEGISIDAPFEREVLEDAFRNQGIEAVIVSRVVEVAEELEYVPGNFSGNSRYYRDFYGYYNEVNRNRFVNAELFVITTVRIETNLYRADNATVVWSAVTETFNPAGEMDAVESLNAALIKALQSEGFLPVK